MKSQVYDYMDFTNLQSLKMQRSLNKVNYAMLKSYKLHKAMLGQSLKSLTNPLPIDCEALSLSHFHFHYSEMQIGDPFYRLVA